MKSATDSFRTILCEFWSEANKYGDRDNRFKLSLSTECLFGKMRFFIEARWFQNNQVHLCQGPQFNLDDGPEWVTLTHRLREVTEMVRRKQEKLMQEAA